ncbi:ATP-dependent DNA helicase RecG [Mangrovibacillus cuniculi]|uniref:ATP-dependent DNA helicase RecG n=1 Tax=Mangrovibacillus cuniculi TaxID=2593652 RepID=A0A7S8HEX3_9BACI|nr:ATP-dependent DNA helicase RecG [Mangrovibacillus cuniculi]QPC46309.1 ATP-dependent DNA helicase RecG [Mangrovibacillus cuniculi]
MNELKEIKGIGSETLLHLKDLGIHTLHDLLHYFPFRYDDQRLVDVAEASHEERITIEGKVHSEPGVMFYQKGKSKATVRIQTGRHLIAAVFFNQPYLKKAFSIGDIVTLTGKWDAHRQVLTVQSHQKGPHKGQTDYAPVYHLKVGITNLVFRKWMKQAFQLLNNTLPETLPTSIREQYKLPNKFDALHTMHFPENEGAIKQARRYFVYEELLLFQLKMQALKKKESEQKQGNKMTVDQKKIDAYKKSLPFPLTAAQTRVVDEIIHDLTSNGRMNRLLQGDVGSGKTVVASIALLAAHTAGYQGALMVPTEILAEQHASSLADLLQPTGITVALLTSSVKGKARRLLLESLAEGEIDILIGTHALIQEDVVFSNLGLVITDEQHRFGVNQRKILREKGLNPDVLFMTATPIPRTLAITVFGEMDVSIIDELPAGRKPIETYWVKSNYLERVVGFIEKEVKKGRQAYVICPLIEESEKLDVQNAIEMFEVLKERLKGITEVGLMHGRLHPEQKDQVMKEFAENETGVLVSTTVVEVGVNVPNATLMVIQDADRFGLSQLHQLRGRVGRGDQQSYCILMADPKTEVGKERMSIMCETNDGFVLSERDLELRGAGDFFGKKQSGLPEFKVADLVHDYRALEVARSDAEKLISSSVFWDNPEYIYLRQSLESSGATEGNQLD